MSNYSNNVIPINRKAAGASAAGSKVGGQFASRVRPPGRVSLAATEGETVPESLRMAHFQDPELVQHLDRYLVLGAKSDDPAYYEDKFAELIPHVSRYVAGEVYCSAMDVRSDGYAYQNILDDVAARDTENHPGAGLTEGYEPPSILVGERGTRQRSVTTGSNYDGTYRDAAAVAKDVRVDLKAAVAGNYLPSGLTFSVRSEKHSQAQAVTVEIRGLSDEDRLSATATNRWGDPETSKGAAELLKRVETITGSYNREDPDNFSSMYYGRVSIETDRSRELREQEAAARKASRA